MAGLAEMSEMKKQLHFIASFIREHRMHSLHRWGLILQLSGEDLSLYLNKLESIGLKITASAISAI